MIAKQYRLTQDGIDELKAELERLHAARPVIADAIKTAREFGDLAENAEYQTARQESEKNDARIAEVEHILANVELITSPKKGGKVQLGSNVTLTGTDGKTKEFKVVGTVEADPLNGKVSDESPIGQALLGKKEGEDVEIKTPASTATFKITAIS